MNIHNVVEKETKEVEVNALETMTTPAIASRNDSEMESTIKDNKNGNRRMSIEIINIIVTSVFSIALIVVGIAQYLTYNKQADIASNANKLSQYQYRFEFYRKLGNIQKTTSILKKEPQLEIEEFSELNFEILSLLRESKLLFNKDISQNINKILTDHMNFLVELNNEGMYYDDYKKEMSKLNMDYGDFLNSDSFKMYLDINRIE
ncbi:hypothetical protein Back11_46300 [Paenibacillus baekrokdamisoli]|uniref:Uncharacterized protein n=2 Tax=Paenibacillus baekrokdamisoli TaxID=1712516 RepID=A0A3G9J4L0_9BACL|nr:hypothetical protein [Paenibacillus baekrokdamisoli]MBB3073283.1 hypothetical protein [Paenibacillus baekrokdamisoli]BBH23285.1 hypothetical protein Back11_46300 [Paenibacillus baekrokdamisoli]